MKYTNFNPTAVSRDAQNVSPLSEASGYGRRCAKKGINGKGISALRMKNRLLAALLAPCLALSLAACGGSSAPASATATEPPAPAVTETPAPAVTEAPSPAAAEAWEYKTLGVTLHVPKEYTETKGIVDVITDDSILGGSAAGEAIAENNAANGENAYRIFVADQNSDPVAGATVQFCTADTCKLGTTDENGVAVFDDPEGVYEVHILKVPDGYRNDETVYATPSVYSDLVITVEKG